MVLKGIILILIDIALVLFIGRNLFNSFSDFLKEILASYDAFAQDGVFSYRRRANAWGDVDTSARSLASLPSGPGSGSFAQRAQLQISFAWAFSSPSFSQASSTEDCLSHSFPRAAATPYVMHLSIASHLLRPDECASCPCVPNLP